MLSGGFFDGPPAPDKGWHEDERAARGYGSADSEDAQSNEDSDVGHHHPDHASGATPASIGMGPGRTGVKGVIRDRDEATSLERARRAKAVDDMNRQMEKANLGGKTFLEEEREKAVAVVFQARDVFGRRKEGRRFGHLREVGVDGFVPAVEEEERGVWVIVHLYEPVRLPVLSLTHSRLTKFLFFKSLERCAELDDTLAHLARIHPDTKFLRALASSLGFASNRPHAAPESAPTRRVPGHFRDDSDDDEHDDGSYSDEDEDDDRRSTHVDLDVLPTLLVYRGGDLVHNWVRVDWEAGRAGIEELLSQSVSQWPVLAFSTRHLNLFCFRCRHHILPEIGFAREDEDLLDDDLDDDDEDLPWSD